MKESLEKYIYKKEIQIAIYLIVNALFILKYTPRYNANPYVALGLFVVFFFSILFLYRKMSNIASEKLFKIAYWSMVLMAICLISISLIYIDPYSVRVDRWSALTFFWDAAFKGIYPYGAHTHVSLTNFPSPFPAWQLISLPFYLLGDVGIEIIFFLLLLSFALKQYFSTYKKSFFFLMLLLITPCYWWEILVRSDGLSNSFLIFMIILWLIKTDRGLSNNFMLMVLICGVIAATRFTAVLPMILFLFRPYLELSTSKKIKFPIYTLLITLLFFLPFIFWDTNTWVFFSRNPFMSQTGNGNGWLLLIMIIVGIFFALSWKSVQQFFWVTSVFIFIFILSSQIMYLQSRGGEDFFGDGIVDLSYFNLSLPYCIAFLTDKLGYNKQNKI